MKTLILKTGALGDVVRTQYFPKYLVEQRNCEITWLTSTYARDILQDNPYISRIVTEPSILHDTRWDEVYSLEDDAIVCSLSNRITTPKWIGLKCKSNNFIYDQTTQEWNDMGIHSRHGIVIANLMKLQNTKSHLEMFEKIFRVRDVIPNWKGELFDKKATIKTSLTIGCNFFAGNRWPNKSVTMSVATQIIRKLEVDKRVNKILILGELSKSQTDNFRGFSKAIIPNTSSNISELFKLIRSCDYVVTSDSLGVHIAMAARTPFVCFFGPTSASEISDPILNHINIKSSSPSYCSYDPRAEIEGLTSERIYAAFDQLIQNSTDEFR